ncbi:ester cyclase [uncultured Paludibaculum sp.]|uniref:ester cyclase n=1 Tax=uncultured Paludibaculum sp. TaxID=1765020 RepID=UPI002AABA782|nr:ester cyclase [uncultured Paludibaculum sp.]
MSTRVNRATVNAYINAFNRGDFEAIAGLCTEDVAIQGILGNGGLGVATSIWRELHEAYQVHLEVEDLVAEGSIVAVRYSESGTFVKPFRGTQPTGKSYTLVAMEWFHLRDGKIAARWGVRDAASMMKQLGVA